VAQPEQQYETKERKKKTHHQIPFTTQSYALSPAQRKSFEETENTLMAQDLDILEMKELRNILEAYAYEMRNNLDSYGSFEKYLDEATKASFMADINETVKWLYEDGETAPKSQYKTRIEKFKAIGEPVR
jgi:heat shock protein 5